MLTKKLIAEAIGTFALLFAGMLSIANDATLLGVAFAHGLAIAVMAMALGTVSGGQFNPAISIGLSLTGHQKWSDTLAFIPAQFVGGILGAFAAVAVAGQDAMQKVGVGYGAATLGSGVSVGGGLLAEAITTAFLVLVVVKVAIHQKSVLGGLIVGLTIVVGILSVGPISGATMNPARALGAAVAGGTWANMWIYFVGPILGGALGAWLANFTEDLRPKPVPVGEMN
ncbi:MIP/aquaporin family protein [Deinococcus sp. AJ005]|uniref:MIP/aquaporin family protein n=1 Tax=Deinococcus sp. AJ005 TaxID=2652443 RepID=UPI00125CAC25|nr:aquaporin [Deinococcus sp. AJ005]QFP78114.1 aquaporin [Deinococcus sp. AJ005]